MTLQQLEYIIALDNHRHYVRAAEACFVTQPNLTMQVKKLEDEIGLRIFDRVKKPLIPTPAGEQIILKVRHIIREVEEMKAFVNMEIESLVGDFKLGIIPTLAPYLIPLFLPGFIQKYPQTHLHIQDIQTDKIIEGLIKGTIDIGILVTPLEENTIREIPMFNEPFLLYLPANHPYIQQKNLSPDDIEPENVLVLKEGHCFREQALQLCKNQQLRSSSGFEYQSGSIETLKGLVKKGLGYTLIPELSVLKHLDEKHIRRFSSPEPIREVSIAVRNTFTKEKLIEVLHEAILHSIPDSFNKINRYIRVKWR